jgi:putative ABC transport system permease protein
MSFFSAIRVALAALLVNKGRSVLTSLGIVIGIAAVIAMVSAGGGARYKLDDRLESVGKNLILIKPGSRTQLGIAADSTPLRKEDASAIRKQAGTFLTGVAESQMTQKVANTRYGSHFTALVGSTPELQQIRNWKVDPPGRFYTDEELKSGASVCLLGHTLRKTLFPQNNDPIGESVRVGFIHLRVVGVLEEKGRSPTGGDQDDQLFLPLATLQQKLTNSESLALILTSAKSAELVERAKDEVIKVLRERHHIKPGAADDFDVSTVQEMAELAVILTATMQYLVAVIASISLVVGGIGIMNIMLVSVTERTREIGIRMAIGATPADVLTQFLIEAVVLALVGGVIGITLGIGATIGVAKFADWPIVVQPEIVALAFAVAAGVGIFFGYYPALKASRLDPIDALRYE